MPCVLTWELCETIKYKIDNRIGLAVPAYLDCWSGIIHHFHKLPERTNSSPCKPKLKVILQDIAEVKQEAATILHLHVEGFSSHTLHRTAKRTIFEICTTVYF